MTPDQFRTARKALGLSQHGMAEALGMGKWGFQSVSKWERGLKPISPRVALAVKGLMSESHVAISKLRME